MKFTTVYSNDVIIIAGESEVSQTSKPDGNTKTKPSGDVCSYICRSSCVMVYKLWFRNCDKLGLEIFKFNEATNIHTTMASGNFEHYNSENIKIINMTLLDFWTTVTAWLPFKKPWLQVFK